MAGRPATISRDMDPSETPPITRSVKIRQVVPIVAIGGSRLRSSTAAELDNARVIGPRGQTIGNIDYEAWSEVLAEFGETSTSTSLRRMKGNVQGGL